MDDGKWPSVHPRELSRRSSVSPSTPAPTSTLRCAASTSPIESKRFRSSVTPPLDRPGAAADAGAGAVGDHRQLPLARQLDHLAHLVFGARPHHRVGRRGNAALANPQQGQRPDVARVAEAIEIVRRDAPGDGGPQLRLRLEHSRGREAAAKRRSTVGKRVIRASGSSASDAPVVPLLIRRIGSETGARLPRARGIERGHGAPSPSQRAGAPRSPRRARPHRHRAWAARSRRRPGTARSTDTSTGQVRHARRSAAPRLQRRRRPRSAAQVADASASPARGATYRDEPFGPPPPREVRPGRDARDVHQPRHHACCSSTASTC